MEKLCTTDQSNEVHMARFVKGQKRPKGAGWKSETKDKRKRVHEIFDEAFDKLAARIDLSSGLTQALITAETLSK